MGFSLPDGTQPSPPPPPPSLAFFSSSAKSNKSDAKTNKKNANAYTRCFLVMIGNIKGEMDRSNRLTALEEIYMTSDSEFVGRRYLNKDDFIEFNIDKDSSISMYIWTKGSELKDAVQLEKLHWKTKKLTFSFVELIFVNN